MKRITSGIVFLTLCGSAAADDWPGFRGPTGLGHTNEKNLPLKWDAKTGDNIAWRAPLVGEGHASPIVWKDRVFITTVRWPGGTPDKKVMPEHHVLCYAAADGRKLWDTLVKPGPWLRSDFRSGPGGGYAAPTPATDGERLFVLFGSSVLAALDFDGKVLWRLEIRPHTFDVTIGTSPVLFGDTVIVHCAMSKPEHSRVVAFRKSDGSIAWESKTPGMRFGHSTPVLVDVAGKPQLVVLASGMGSWDEALQAFDPTSGERIWWCKAAGDASSPAFGSGVLYADSGRGGVGTALDPAGTGNLSANIKWTSGKLSEAIGSPIILGDHLFRIQRPNIVRIWKVTDGTETDRQRLDGLSTTWASPIATADDRVYFASGGKSMVLQAGPKVKVLAVNDLGDPNHASPAVSNGRIYIAGTKKLFAIGPR